METSSAVSRIPSGPALFSLTVLLLVVVGSKFVLNVSKMEPIAVLCIEVGAGVIAVMVSGVGGGEMSRSCSALICEVSTLPVTVKACVVYKAVNVPIVYWPSPPFAFELVKFKVTLPPVAPVVVSTSLRFWKPARESSTHTWTAYVWPTVKALSVTIMGTADDVSSAPPKMPLYAVDRLLNGADVVANVPLPLFPSPLPESVTFASPLEEDELAPTNV